MSATALIAALAALWGSGFLWIRLSLEAFTPTQLTFARLALGALVLVPVVLARRLAWPRTTQMWGHLVVSAVLGNAIPYTLFAVAEQSVPSSVAGALNGTTPVWTVLLVFALSRGGSREVTPRRALGVLLGFIGAVAVAEPWSSGTEGSVTGTIAAALAALSYAVAYTYQGRYLTNRGISPLTLTAAQLVTAAGLLLPTLPLTGAVSTPTTLPLVAVVILGVAGTGLALVINFTLISREGATSASVVTYLVPLVAVLLGILILGEPARWTLLVGAVFILIGVAFVRLDQNRRDASSGE